MSYIRCIDLLDCLYKESIRDVAVEKLKDKDLSRDDTRVLCARLNDPKVSTYIQEVLLFHGTTKEVGYGLTRTLHSRNRERVMHAASILMKIGPTRYTAKALTASLNDDWTKQFSKPILRQYGPTIDTANATVRWLGDNPYDSVDLLMDYGISEPTVVASMRALDDPKSYLPALYVLTEYGTGIIDYVFDNCKRRLFERVFLEGSCVGYNFKTTLHPDSDLPLLIR